MTKRLIAFVIVLAMLVACLPVGVLAEGSQVVGEHGHTDAHKCSEQCAGGTIVWTAWGKTNGNNTSLPTQSGHYYLEDNITLSARNDIPAGTDITICLNGWNITETGNGNVSYVFGKLTVSDCTAGYEDGTYVSGAVTGCSFANGGAFNVRPGGTLVLESGKLSGNSGTGGAGGAISLASGSPGGVFYMYGGEITGNSNSNGGGVVANNGGQAYIYGGRIAGNTATGKGKAIYIAGANSRLTVSGAPYIEQVYFDNASNPGLQVSGLTANAKIGVNTVTATATLDQTMKLVEGAEQEAWDCHWVTINGKSVSRDDNGFKFGHFHGEQEYSARTTASGLPTGAVAGQMNYYYLAEDNIRSATAAQADLTKQVTICLNGFEIRHNNPAGAIYSIKAGGALVLEDSWAHTDANGIYQAGGVTYTGAASTAANGVLFNVAGGSFTLNSGEIFGVKGKSAAVSAVGGAVTVNGGLIRDNENSATAGAIRAQDGTVFTMTGGTFKNNQSTGGQAGAVYLLRGTANITGGEFIGNFAKQDAGSLYIHTSTGSLSGVKFTGNKSNASGCGFGVSGASNVTVSNVTVTGNTGSNGAVIIQGSAKVTLSDSAITGNTITRGAGIYLAGTADLTLSNVTITGNTATTAAGGLFWDGASSKLTLSGSTKIENNTCKGAVQNLYMNNAAQMLAVKDLASDASVGISNRAGFASQALAADYSASFSADEAGNVVSFKENKLYISNGHEHCQEGTTDCGHTQEGWTTWTATDSLPADAGNYFLQNDVQLKKTWSVSSNIKLCLNGKSITKVAETGSRVITIQAGGNLTITDCQEGGTITGGTGITVSRGTNSLAGAVLNLYAGSLTGFNANEGVIYMQSGQANKPGGTFNMYGGQISGNTAKTGGIVCVKGETGSNAGKASTFNLYDGKLTDNQVTELAGGVYVIGNAVVNMYGGEISGNTSGGSGAGIYATEGASVNISGGAITGNTAGGQGGGIYINKNSKLAITGGAITDNNATKDGGGIYAHTVSVGIQDCEISGNVSKASGGGIGFGGTSTGGLINVTVSDNFAPNGGGMIVQGTSKVTVEEVTIEDNEASKHGGGVYVNSGAQLTLGYDCEVKDNTAQQNGGGIFVEKTGTLTVEETTVTTNKAEGLGGGVYVSDTAVLKLEIAPVIRGNEGSNIYLVDGVKMQVSELGSGAALSVTGNPGAISEACDDYSAHFLSDSGYRKVAYVSGALHLISADGFAHKHCVCDAAVSSCDHKGIDWNVWEKTDSLPTSGYYYLLNDVVLTGEASISKDLTLCLNGHTVKAAENKRILSTPRTATATITITDCTAVAAKDGGYVAGMLTSGVDVANATGGGAIFIRANSTLNLYGGKITGNKSVTAGGGILLADSATFNMYGGEISNNGAKDEGKFIDGAGIYAMANSTVRIAGGKIADNAGQNGGGIYAGANSTLTIAGGTISGNHANAQGGGIYARQNCELIISGGEILNNTSVKDGGGAYAYGSIVTISGGTLQGNTSKASGGGIGFSNKAQVTMTGGTITGNTSPNGGGMIVQGGAALELKDGQIIGNTSTSPAGGIYVSTNSAITMTGGTIADNTAGGNAGGLYINGGTGKITGGTISGNFATKDGGGAYCAGQTGYMEIGGTVLITGNETKGAGGGVGFTKKSTGKITGGTVQKNKAGNAGGVIIQGGANVEVTNVTVKGNFATSSGGGMYVNNSTLTMSGGTVTGNSNEKGYGGGMMTYNSAITLTGGSFTYNTSYKDGGGIYFSQDSVVKLSGMYIAGNVSTKGAGAGFGATKQAQVTMTGGTVTGNKAGNAAGIIIQGKAHLNMYGGTVSNNEANTGGGMYVNNSSANLQGGTIKGNTAVKNGGGVYTYNSAITTGPNLKITANECQRYGGGMYFNLGTADINGTTFNENVSVMGGSGFYTFKTETKVKDVQVSGNKVTNSTGGGVVLSRETKFNWTGGVVEDNYASHGGAGLLIQNWAEGTITGLTVRNNESGVGGGGIFCYTCVDANFVDCEIYGNKTSTGGAGVFLSSPRGSFDPLSYINFTGCKIYDNQSGDMGAGVYISKQIISTWTDCQIYNNTSGTNGGGMYTLAGSITTLDDVSITGNQSGAMGSALYIGDDFTMHDVTITGNKAKEGAAVFFPANDYDGQSYQLGHYTMSGDLIITDNEGTVEDLYISAGTAIGTTAAGFGPKTEIGVQLESGVLTNTVLAAYNYEGGDQVYTVTYGDRSLTEPEYEAPVDAQPQEEGEQPMNIALYIGVGLFALAAVLAVILVLVKKKKPAEANKE